MSEAILRRIGEQYCKTFVILYCKIWLNSVTNDDVVNNDLDISSLYKDHQYSL